MAVIEERQLHTRIWNTIAEFLGITAPTAALTGAASTVVLHGDGTWKTDIGAKITTISTGVGAVKMSSINVATNAAWIPITTADGTVYYVPGWTTNSP